MPTGSNAIADLPVLNIIANRGDRSDNFTTSHREYWPPSPGRPCAAKKPIRVANGACLNHLTLNPGPIILGTVGILYNAYH